VLSGEGDGRVEREGFESVEKGGVVDVDRVLRDGKELDLSVLGTPWKRVLRHVASVKVEDAGRKKRKRQRCWRWT